MRSCFKTTASWLLAAASLGAAGLPAPPAQVSSVVRLDRRTGRLVRAVVGRSPQKQRAAAPAVAEAVKRVARAHALDPLLIHSVIQAESNYNPFAISPKGAQGLMQLMPSTARRFGVTNSFDVAENLDGGTRYLRYLLDLFQDERLAVAAYNAGEEAVIRYGGVPPYPETQHYVRAVSQNYSTARQTALAAAAVQEEPVKPSEPEYRPIEAFIDQQGNVHLRTK